LLQKYYSAGGDVSFVLCLVEEGEGKDGDGCCTLDVQFVCQGVSVLVIGSSINFSSCDEASCRDGQGT